MSDLFLRLFTGKTGKGWRTVELKDGRGAAKTFGMLDGTMSDACIAKGYMMIFRYPVERRDYSSIKPMHLLLKVSYENLSRFYPPGQANEIYCIYKRLNRLNM